MRGKLIATLTLVALFGWTESAHAQRGSENRSGSECPPGPFDCAASSEEPQTGSPWWCFWCAAESEDDGEGENEEETGGCSAGNYYDFPCRFNQPIPIMNCEDPHWRDACPFKAPPGAGKEPKPGYYQASVDPRAREILEVTQRAMRAHLERADMGAIIHRGWPVRGSTNARLRVVAFSEQQKRVSEEFQFALNYEEVRAGGEIVRVMGIYVWSSPGSLRWTISGG